MNTKKIYWFFQIMCIVVVQGVSGQEVMQLTYNLPAEKWTEALPIGNVNLGAMIYGGVEHEHIQFNEETLWEGRPHDYSHEGASKYLGEIRQLLADGKQVEAQNLADKEFMSVPLQQIHYQPFGDLYLDFKGHDNYLFFPSNK